VSLILAVFALLSTAAAEETATTPAADEPKPPEAQVGQAAPRFYLPALGGGDFFLSKWCGPPSNRRPRRGEPRTVVLSFFAKWCAPCRDELPLLEELSRAYGDQPVIWRLVNVGDTPDSVRAFLDDISVDMPVLMDRYARTSGRYCGEPVQAPTVVVIDTAGIVRYLHHGFDRDRGREQMTRVAEAIGATTGMPVPEAWRGAHHR